MNKGITRLHFDWWVSLSESLSDGILNSPANFCHDLVVKNQNLIPVRRWMMKGKTKKRLSWSCETIEWLPPKAFLQLYWSSSISSPQILRGGENLEYAGMGSAWFYCWCKLMNSQPDPNSIRQVAIVIQVRQLTAQERQTQDTMPRE